MKLSNFAQEKAEDPIDRNFGIINNFFMSLECKGFNPDQVAVKVAELAMNICHPLAKLVTSLYMSILIFF